MTFDNTLADIINQNTTFGSETGSAYPVRGWRKVGPSPEAFPVLMKKDTNINLTLRHKIEVDWAEPTPGVLYDLSASQSLSGLFYNWPAQQGTAAETFQSKSFVSQQKLPNKIHKWTYNPAWQALAEEPFGAPILNTGSETAFVTWDSPLGEVATRIRINWVVTAADGATTDELAADGVHQAIPLLRPGHTNIVPGGQEWKLMDPSSVNTFQGECDEYARLMKKIMNLLGIQASVTLIYASTDANVESAESRIIDGQLYWLVMDFGEQDWNGFEGVCLTAGKCYAVWPKYKADSVQHMFMLLPFTQYWCRTSGDAVPGFFNAVGIYWYPVVSYRTPAEPKPNIYP
jgi:hypothetical protein